MAQPTPLKNLLWLYMKEDWDNIHILYKYHPKHYHKVQFTIKDLQHSKFLSKLKRIKIIKALDALNYDKSKITHVLSAFQPQCKQIKHANFNDPSVIKYFPDVSTYLLCPKSPKSWKTFLQLSGLRTLTVECPGAQESTNSKLINNYFSGRFWLNFSKLKQLENLTIQLYNQIDQEALEFLHQLDHREDFLASLKTITLFVTHMNHIPEENLRFFNFYKYITLLRIHESSYSAVQILLTRLETFENLEYFNIVKTFNHPAENPSLEDFHYLQHLHKLIKLKTIDITINLNSAPHLQSFLANFTAPTTITSLKFNFYETNWASLIPKSDLFDLKDFNHFEHRTLCQTFYQGWSNLESLESLSLCFTEPTSKHIPNLYFIAPLLRQLKRLNSFFYANWCIDLDDTIKALNFNFLWQALKNLMPTLKKIYVESYAISLKDFSNNFVSKDLKLEELGFSGFVLGDVNLNTLTNLFPSSPTETLSKQRSPQSSAILEVERLAIHNKDSFTKVLQTLSNIPRHLDLLINLDVRKISADDFIGIICQCVHKISKKGSIKLKFSQIPDLPQEYSEIFHQTLSEYEASRNLFIFGKQHYERPNVCGALPHLERGHLEGNRFREFLENDEFPEGEDEGEDDEESIEGEEEDEEEEEIEEERSGYDEDDDSESDDHFDDIEEDF